MNYDWDVTRTTTDKLAGELNDFAWDIYQIQYIGGRDWVIITRQRAQSQTGPYSGYARRNKAGTFWEITIPSMGPNDEYIVTQAKTAAEVQQAAKEAIAAYNDVAVEDVEVDIDVDTRPQVL